MVKYRYNAWGTATQVITQGCEELDVLYNPFKFKGYFYDGETGFYYLKTRYYAPVVGKFISMDATKYLDPKSLNGTNLYAYCNNNPIMYADKNGNLPAWAIYVAQGVIGVSGLLFLAVGAASVYYIIKGIRYLSELYSLLKGNVYFEKGEAKDLIPTIVINGDKFAIESNFSLLKIGMYLDKNKNTKIELDILNANTFIGYELKEGKLGFDLGGNIFSIEGVKCGIGANFDFGCISLAAMFDDGDFSFGDGLSLFDYGFSINVVKIIGLIKKEWQ